MSSAASSDASSCSSSHSHVSSNDDETSSHQQPEAEVEISISPASQENYVETTPVKTPKKKPAIEEKKFTASHVALLIEMTLLSFSVVDAFDTQ